MKFRAQVIPSGNATGVEVPDEVMQALGPAGRPPVTITINGHTWRSRVAAMRGQHLIGISTAHRAAARISEGDIIEIDVQLDEAPREVVEPADLADALDNCPRARTSFDRLPFGLQQKHVRAIQEARSAEVRERRIGKLIVVLEGSPPRKV
ncbi:YdeI/OmpD-associated family protein [Pseudaminobacter salicylatoxidans]|uniref:YdeI/OmpD-associated family protein n=1 Tax=Pseudaminobacter salicylatoxidans TaxID=93369 RepID=UPI000A013EB7|nr:YdeI/OmpD-associated family protein [Pseudaminobacter salicylatoxidans]